MSRIIDHLEAHNFNPPGVKNKENWTQRLSDNIGEVDFTEVKDL